jgi:acetylornithine deacetylase/succinyl-diaminopimelate desuccinylase-like protein
MSAINQYIESNRQRFLDELFDLLRLPSVSADPAYSDAVLKTAEAVRHRLMEAGADNVVVMPTEGYPIVYGEKIINASLPTILVYGNYDVQPPDPLDLWTSEPFEPVIRKTDIHPEGAIFARGACDDKGQMYMHVKAFEAMNRSGELACNVKFLIEGEEEVGSSHLDEFLEKNRDLLKADVVLISDTGIIANDTPSLMVGLRGLSYLEVKVTGPNRDLHSGLYGGAAPNPINILCEMIAKLKDENQRIAIPGFYDDVTELSASERADLKLAPFDEEKFKRSIDIGDVEGEKGYTVQERLGVRPTLDINGIWGGYMGEGAKTVIASWAKAKVSMRLVPNQNSDKITELFKAHFESLAPKSCKVEVTPMHGGEAAVTPTDSAAYRAASRALEEVFGKKPAPVRGGGSIPIVASFERILGLKTVLMGFGLDSDAIHSPNEHYGVFNYFTGIKTIPLFHKYFAEYHKS